MNKEDNLIPTTKMTKEQQREFAKKGNKASQEAKRRKKAMKEQIELLLSLPIQDKKAITQLEKMGIDTENIDNQMAMIISMFKTSMGKSRNAVNAAIFLRDTVGEKPVDKMEQKLDGEITTRQKNAIDDVISQMKAPEEEDT